MFQWFHSLLVQPKRTATVLFWYWIVTAIAFGVYIAAIAAGTDTDTEQLFAHPSAAFSLAYASINLLLAGLLRYSQREAQYLHYFGIFAMVQQLTCANIPGAVLAWALWRASTCAEDETQPLLPTVFWLSVGSLGFVSVVLLIGQISLLLS